MNLLIFIGIFSNGGAEKNALIYARAFSELNHKVTLVISNNSSRISSSDIEKIYGVALADLVSSRTIYSFFKAAKLIRNTKDAVVVVLSPEAQLLIGLISFFVDLRFKIITRNINTVSKLFSNSNKLYLYILKRVYRQSRVIINQSREMAEDFSDFFSLNDVSSVVLYNSLNDSTSLQRVLNSVERKNHIVCAGRLSPQKRFDHAIKAYARIYDVIDDDLLIFGSGSEEEFLKELVASLGLDSRVKFFGYVDNLDRFIKEAKVLILSSEYEGFPNVILESLSLGTPVVSYNCKSGPSELIIDGLNGYLVSNGDICDLSGKMLTSLSADWNYDKVVKSVLKFSYENFRDNLSLLIRDFD